MVTLIAYRLNVHVDSYDKLYTVDSLKCKIQEIGDNDGEIEFAMSRLDYYFNLAKEFGNSHRCYTGDIREDCGFRVFVDFSVLNGMQIHGFLWKEDHGGVAYYVGVLPLNEIFSRFEYVFNAMDPDDFNGWITGEECVDPWSVPVLQKEN